jgi:hypothetical protein
MDNLFKPQETVFIFPITYSHLQETFIKSIDTKKNMIWVFEGNRLISEKRIFHEFFLKLSYPDYFKRNDWDVFNECVQEVDYYNGNNDCNHLFVFEHAISFISLPKKDCEKFFSILTDIETSWSGVPVRKKICTILCCQPHQEHLLMNMLSSIKIPYTIIDCERWTAKTWHGINGE